MKICMLTPRFPFPENGGDVLRLNSISRYLKSKGHTLVLVSFTDYDNSDVESAKAIYNKVYVIRRNKLGSLLHGVLHMLSGKPLQCGYYWSSSYLRLLTDVIEKERPDMYVSHLLRMSPYLEKLGLQSKSVVEMTDALSKTYSMSQVAKGWSVNKIAYFFERSLIAKYEDKVIADFPKVVLVSQADVDYLAQRNERSDSLCVHTNGVNCLSSPSPSYVKEKIVFVGNMRTLQNQDAVFRFVNEIFPKVLKACPEAKFHIVGAQPPASVQALASDNIIVTGYVEDLESEISDACLAVAPVHIAAGIQNKVLVAMGCGVPVILTSLISKAIPELVDGENCFIRDDSDEFADVCVRLMTDSHCRDSVAQSGHQTVLRGYSWNDKLEGYEKI